MSLYNYYEQKISKLIMIAIFNIWSGIDSEKMYWSYILWRKRGYREAARLIPEIRKKIYPRLMLKYCKKGSSVFELGSGPMSDLAWGVEKGLIHVTAADVLAKEYSHIVNKRKVIYPIRPVYGKGEDLSMIKEKYDMVYSRNALDHTQNPALCVENMVSILKQNGYLYICGNVKEGTNVHWQGLHQHDLVAQKNGLIHYDSKGNRTNLTKNRGLRLVHLDKTGDNVGNSFNMIFQKGIRVPAMCACSLPSYQPNKLKN